MLFARDVIESTIDGPGVRIVVFFQGCPHRCFNCHNKQTWRYVPADGIHPEEFLKQLDNEYIAGVTLSGGEPLFQNIVELIDFCKLIKEKYPKKTIWVYTGYTYEQVYSSVEKSKILDYIDVLVDGPYVDSLRDLTLQFRGSSNQRLIDVQKSTPKNVVLYKTN